MKEQKLVGIYLYNKYFKYRFWNPLSDYQIFVRTLYKNKK